MTSTMTVVGRIARIEERGKTISFGLGDKFYTKNRDGKGEYKILWHNCRTFMPHVINKIKSLGDKAEITVVGHWEGYENKEGKMVPQFMVESFISFKTVEQCQMDFDKKNKPAQSRNEAPPADDDDDCPF